MAMDQFSEWRLKSQKMELENDFYFDYETEEIANYQDPSVLLAALKQKEEEVILAAQLGNALLLENRQLKEESEKVHEQYADKLEALKQDRHELQLKLEGCQSQWEAQVGELERDSGELSSQVGRLSQALGEAEKDKARAVEEHGEHTQLLREQLSTAMEAEKSMSNELQALKQELRQRGNVRPQDEELLSAMREQVARLTQKELALKDRLEIVFQENADLRQSLASLHTRLAHQDRCTEEQRQQLAEACREAEAARGRSQELQSQVEELQEELSLQSSGCRGDASLLSELETSLDSVRLDCTCSDNKQLTQDVLSVLQLLLPLTQQTDVPIDSGVKSHEGGLQALLHQLKGVAQTLTRTCCTQELNPAFVEGWRDLRGNRSVTQEQRDQNTKLQEENDALRLRLKNREEEKEEEEKGIARQAIKDRDEAISKKNLMEVELVRTKSDMMCLNNQLLEAIQRKLELSQELEAWQDDIQVIINQQLRAQQQTEQLQRKPASNPMAFFRRPSTAPSTWARRPSASPSWASEACQEKPQSPWRDWLRRGKVAQHGK